jgi:uncharacterized membrane protein
MPQEPTDIPTHPPEASPPVAVPSPPVPPPSPTPTPTPASPDPAPAAPSPTTPGPTILGEPLDKEKVLSFIENLIDTLTFKRVLLIALLTLVGLVLNTVFENRKQIVDKFIDPKPAKTEDAAITNWVLSDSSKASLINLAKTTNVTFISITDVDLKKNRRAVKYYYLDDPTIKINPSALQALSLPNAVFDFDPKNTAQMVAVLSNEFRCDAYRDTINYRYAPELADRLPTVCRLAVPPFVGQFVGFITIATDRIMSKDELNTIRLEVSRLAVEIYLNDVVRKPASK